MNAAPDFLDYLGRVAMNADPEAIGGLIGMAMLLAGLCVLGGIACRMGPPR